MKELICIICPRGCHLTVDEENGYAVSGNHCPRGVPYAKAEVQNPTRVLTTTVHTTSKQNPSCPVKTTHPIPKHLLFEAMKKINQLTVETPLKRGDVICANLLNTGSDVIATRDLN